MNDNSYSPYSPTIPPPKADLTALPSSIEVFDLPLTAIPINGKDKSFTVSSGIVKMNSTATGAGNIVPVTLIKFGAFLAMLQKICNITDGKANTLLQFEMVDHISDPSTQLTKDDTFIVTYPGNYSANPNKCLIKYSGYDPNIVPRHYIPTDILLNSFLSRTFEDGADNTLAKLPNPALAMRLSDVYININFIASVLANLRGSDMEADSELDISIIDLLKDILSGVNTSLGGLNDFKVKYSETNAQIQIISESPILNQKISNSKKATINTFGFNTKGKIKNGGSFVKSMDLNSELTDRMATQISVGAQNNGNTLNGNATSFSSYSKGLIDVLFKKKESSLRKTKGVPVITTEMEEWALKHSTRGKTLAPEILNSTTFKNSVKSAPFIFSEDKINDALNDAEAGAAGSAFNNIYGNLQFGDKQISSLESLVTNISPLIMGAYLQNSNSPAPFFLPFNMSLEMLGLGGIRIYDTFSINGKGLPLSYNPSTIQLIVKSLTHTVSLEGWTTKIETLSSPDFPVEDSIVFPSTPKSSIPSGGKSNAECELLITQSYSPTAGKSKYRALLGYPYDSSLKGDDPIESYTFQGKKLNSFSKMMNSGDGERLPEAGWGIAFELGKAIQKIGEAATAAGLTNLTINSHYRSPVWNCKNKGVSDSIHLTGGAVDIGTTNSTKLREIILELINKGDIPKGGVGRYNNFIHYDIRGYNETWDKRDPLPTGP